MTSADTSTNMGAIPAVTADPAAMLPPEVRALYPFTVRTLRLPRGEQMCYLDEGPRDAPAILMVHGNPTWSFFFRALVFALRDRFRCIVPDHVGCGLSDKPAKYDYWLGRHTENLGTLVDALGLTRTHLIVHDWGGAIGLGMARTRPELVDRLVVLNTAAFLSRRIPKRIAVCRWPALGALLVRGGNAFSRAAVRMTVQRELPPAVRLAYLWPYRSWAERIAVHRFVRDIPLGPLDRSYDEVEATEESLPRYRGRRALVVWGMHDWCFNEEFLHEWGYFLHDARMVRLENAGHWLLEDEPDAVCREVSAFLT